MTVAKLIQFLVGKAGVLASKFHNATAFSGSKAVDVVKTLSIMDSIILAKIASPLE